MEKSLMAFSINWDIYLLLAITLIGVFFVGGLFFSPKESTNKFITRLAKHVRALAFISLAVIIVLLIMLLIGSYIDTFRNQPISKDPAHWGQMGDFFGGMLNPILAFASFIALLYTIRIQSEELKLTREELRKSSAAQEQSVINQQSQLLLQQNLEEFKHLCEMLNSWLMVTEKHQFAEGLAMDSVIFAFNTHKAQEPKLVPASAVVKALELLHSTADLKVVAYVQASMNAAIIFADLVDCNRRINSGGLDNVISAYASKVADKFAYGWILSRCTFSINSASSFLKPKLDQWFQNAFIDIES
jgi:hypothetical protein